MPDWFVRRALWVAAAVGALSAGLGTGSLVARFHPPPATASAPAAPAAPAQGGWWTPLPRASGAFVPVQLVVERLQVQAPVEAKGIDAGNAMEAPDRPADAAWYRFTAMPGAGGNAVFAGYRDYGGARTAAVFRHLDQLVPGDLLDVVSAARTEVRYRVTRTWDYALSGMPMKDVLATASADEVTLIAPSGTFTSGIGYDHRLVVRGVRVA